MSLHFESYIQYEKYSAFCNAMSSLKGMRIIRLEDGGKEVVAKITVDFDRTGFLSERMRHRFGSHEMGVRALFTDH